MNNTNSNPQKVLDTLIVHTENVHLTNSRLSCSPANIRIFVYHKIQNSKIFFTKTLNN